MSYVIPRWCCSFLGWAAVSITSSSMAFGEDSSGDVQELKRLQARVQETCQSVLDAVVSVDGASGAIITEDGIVLSQYHVSHRRPDEPYETSYQPGHRVRIVSEDGSESTAKSLGADQGHDLSLLKLVSDGPYPFVPVNPKASPKLGDWVVKLGHPAGYQPGRKPVARLGKVVSRMETERLSVFNTDCSINGGDSGGPYFDLKGNLVGIIEGGGRPPGLSASGTMKLRARGLWAATTVKQIDALIPAMLRGEIAPHFAREWPAMYESTRVLDVDDWTQGRHNLEKWKNGVAAPRLSVVRIFDGNYQIALGVVADSGGAVVTKASVLPEHFKCVLADGSEATADVLGTDAAFDIAVLQVQAASTPVAWANRNEQPLGTLLAAPGHAETPLAVGIVSVARRDQHGPFPKEVVHTPRRPASAPAVAGFPVADHGLVVVAVDGNAADAGLLPGDEFIALASSSVSHEDDLQSAVQGFQAGDAVQASVIREGRVVQLDVKLDNRDAAQPPEPRSKFPTVFETDAPVLANELGGPVVNLDGEAIGVTIARVGGYGCAAVPSDVVKRIVGEHSQK